MAGKSSLPHDVLIGTRLRRLSRRLCRGGARARRAAATTTRAGWSRRPSPTSDVDRRPRPPTPPRPPPRPRPSPETETEDRARAAPAAPRPARSRRAARGDEVAASSQALFTGRGGKLSPRWSSVPPFIAIRVELRSADGGAYELRGGGKTLRVGCATIALGLDHLRRPAAGQAAGADGARRARRGRGLRRARSVAGQPASFSVGCARMNLRTDRPDFRPPPTPRSWSPRTGASRSC